MCAVKEMRNFIEAQKRFHTFGKYHYPTLDRLVSELEGKTAQVKDDDVFTQCPCGKVKIKYVEYTEGSKVWKDPPEGVWSCEACGWEDEWGT